MDALLFVFVGLALLGVLVNAIGSIMLLVAAFRESALWGLALVFFPIAEIFFLFSHWEEAKPAFKVQFLGFMLVVVSMVAAVVSGIRADPRDLASKLGVEWTAGGPAAETNVIAGVETEPQPAAGLPVDDDFVGKTLDELRQARGFPRARASRGSLVIFLYDDYQYVSRDGITVWKRETAGD